MNTVWMIVRPWRLRSRLRRWCGGARAAAPTDLGFVSQRWVAENRMSQQHEPRR